MDKKGLYPIYGTWHKPFWQTDTFYMILICLGVVASLFLLSILFKKYIFRKKKKEPWEEALIELKKLKIFIKEETINPKEFYLLLTSILKIYFFKRYGFDLFGKTDAEVVLFLGKNQFNKNLLTNITQMFQDSQEIKFAHAQTLLAYLNRDLDFCINLINETVPVK